MIMVHPAFLPPWRLLGSGFESWTVMAAFGRRLGLKSPERKASEDTLPIPRLYSDSKLMAVELKAEGNDLFGQKKYDQAAIKFTKAIELDRSNAILYANRAACHLALKRRDDALSDAKKATELDPHYAKAWGRLGQAHDALTNYAESIESYQRGIAIVSKPNPTATESSLRSGFEYSVTEVKEKIMNPETMSLSVLLAMARAHDIPVPTPHTMDNMPAIHQAVWHHPKFTTDPPLRLFLIPQDEKEPLRQIELVRGSNVKEEICKILGCKMTDTVVLHSEDLIAHAKGKADGVGYGRIHTSYEAFMDDFALSRRPLNRRASTLLRRPDTHGPILVMKTTFIKANDSGGRSEDILCWEEITEAELKGDAFKKLREEWVAIMGSGDLPHILEVRRPR